MAVLLGTMFSSLGVGGVSYELLCGAGLSSTSIGFLVAGLLALGIARQALQRQLFHTLVFGSTILTTAICAFILVLNLALFALEDPPGLLGVGFLAWQALVSTCVAVAASRLPRADISILSGRGNS